MKAEQWVTILARDPERETVSAIRVFSALSAALAGRLHSKGDREEIAGDLSAAFFSLRILREIFGVGNLEIEERIQRKVDGFSAEKDR